MCILTLIKGLSHRKVTNRALPGWEEPLKLHFPIRNHWAYVAMKHLRCGQCPLRGALNVKEFRLHMKNDVNKEQWKNNVKYFDIFSYGLHVEVIFLMY